MEKDELRLTTELYKDRTLIFGQSHTGIRVDAFGELSAGCDGCGAVPSEIGKYEVVCTVRDQSGVGIGKYSFTVVSTVRSQVGSTIPTNGTNRKI